MKQSLEMIQRIGRIRGNDFIFNEGDDIDAKLAQLNEVLSISSRVPSIAAVLVDSVFGHNIDD